MFLPMEINKAIEHKKVITRGYIAAKINPTYGYSIDDN